MPKKSSSGRTTLLFVASFIAACGSHPPRPAVVSQPPAVAAPPSDVPAADYRIDPVQSEIRLLVYRAGPLAYLGHNHVIINRQLSGTARVAVDMASDHLRSASFSLVIPVAQFVVDDAEARNEEGEGFSTEVSEEAKSGTLHNMLSAELLNVAQYPTIKLASANLTVERGAVTSLLALDVAGIASTLLVPLTLQRTDDVFTATGRVTLRQSALGLTPFRALLGALAVQDEFTVKFKVVAVPR